MNETDFTRNITELLPFLKNYSAKLCRNTDVDFEDLLQVTLMRAWANRENYVDDNFCGWICVILKNTFLSMVRKESHYEKVSDEELKRYSIPETDNDSLSYVNTAIRTLPFVVREIFVWRVLGYKYREIAETYKLPIGTVKGRIRYARLALQKMLS